MKKLFLFYAALITLTLPLFSCGDSGNQKSKQDITDSTKQNKQIITTRATPPSANTMIPIASAHSLIAVYQSTVAAHHPSAYLVKASGLKTLLNNMSSTNCYLHIYLAANDVNCNSMFIGLVPTIFDQNTQHIHHDLSTTYNTDLVLCSTETDPNCCTIQDALDNGLDVYTSETCDITNCVESFIRKEDIVQSFSNYQTKFSNAGQTGPVYPHTQSFLINASQIRDFLNNPPAGTSPQYIEFYIGYNSADNTTKDHLTILTVGVDANGNHIYAQSGGQSQVFDESMPCPLCNVDADPKLPNLQITLHDPQ